MLSARQGEGAETAVMKEKSVCVTGHRVLPGDFSRSELNRVLRACAEEGYLCYYVGMALGFDLICFEELLKLKEHYPIRIIACIPCADQAERFTAAQKRQYRSLCEKADETVVLHERYEEGCMQERNRYMVDRSERVIAYLRHVGGGTYYTVRYAVEQGKEIVYLK